MTEPMNGLAPENEAGKFDELVAVTIRTAVDEWRVHDDQAETHGVAMPEYIRQALADAGLLAPYHLTHSLCLAVDDNGFTIISDGAEAGRVVELGDTVRQVMRERDAARAPLKSVAESVHPGEFLREELKARGLTQHAFAGLVGRAVQVINRIIKGKQGITPDTALDLERALGVSAGFWVRLQAEHDLALARQRRAVPR